MSKIILGIDPDSKKHGVAIYIDVKLHGIKMMTLMDLMSWIILAELKGFAIESVHIEHVLGNSNSQFHWKPKDSNQVKAKKSESVGLCKQAQTEVERMCEHLEIKVFRHKISKMWKKDKRQFELVTGWTGISNEDTRSAAYFGWLGVNSNNCRGI